MKRSPARALTLEQQQLVESHLDFLWTVVHRLMGRFSSYDKHDLYQWGFLGLASAARGFDRGRGILFTTFAERRVRGAIIDAVRQEAWPRSIRQLRREVETVRSEFRIAHNAEPSSGAIAATLGIPERRFNRRMFDVAVVELTSSLATHAMPAASLPAVLVPSIPATPFETTERHMASRLVRRLFRALPMRERQLIVWYYGCELTLADIGARLGVNESRASQLHARAIARLRGAWKQLQACATKPIGIVRVRKRPRRPLRSHRSSHDSPTRTLIDPARARHADGVGHTLSV